MRSGYWWTGLAGYSALVMGVLGCNSFDEKPPADADEPKLVIPVDERPAVTSAVRPTAVTGGH